HAAGERSRSASRPGTLSTASRSESAGRLLGGSCPNCRRARGGAMSQAHGELTRLPAVRAMIAKDPSLEEGIDGEAESVSKHNVPEGTTSFSGQGPVVLHCLGRSAAAVLAAA